MDNRSPTLDRATVATFGATADAVVLRAFHTVVETRLPSPVFRMMAEQIMYAPFSNTAYLTMARRFEWTFDDFVHLYSRDCGFWSVASYLGYRYVPLRVRYLYVSGATLCWKHGDLLSSLPNDLWCCFFLVIAAVCTSSFAFVVVPHATFTAAHIPPRTPAGKLSRLIVVTPYTFFGTSILGC